MSAEPFSIRASFFPIRLTAFSQNHVEMEVAVVNNTNEIYWLECDVELPDAISLAPDRKLSKGRSRIGIVGPKGRVTKRVKIYGGASSYPDIYKVNLTAYGFDQQGVIQTRNNRKVKLRCERIGDQKE